MTRCVDEIRQLIYSQCHNVETLAGGYYNRHKLHLLRDVGPMLWPPPMVSLHADYVSFILVPYAYPARLR